MCGDGGDVAITDLDEHAHAVERARAYLKRLPDNMEATAVIRTLFDALEYEQARCATLKADNELLDTLLDRIVTVTEDQGVLDIVALRRPPGWYA